MPKTQVLLAFDFGLRKIGVAVGQTVTHSANPLNLLKAHNGIPDWNEIKKLVDEWRVDAFVIGLPLNLDDSEQNISVAARQFASNLQEHFSLPTYLVDERYSSKEAKSQLRHNYVLPDASVDSYAAKLILESWLRSTCAQKGEHGIS